MDSVKARETVKVSSKGQVVIPSVFRKKMGISSGDQLGVTLTDDGQLVLEKLPSSLDWKELIAGIPVEQVDIDDKRHYDPKKSPNFNKWMHEE
ncbi:AbrB/MazE/SpoVT family DNA-binding domain-containing protein [Levilactobacillus tujiorum]|uniref:AbrB/MazE/SpoVT family DNA-binding domain-containing protein n=1 Tax=Levilactobacillus tujiorum TaxID=2912243 RepID=UPI001456B0DD|nr:AbrB/MazE/SpoVT family DNA-binding domain-containing protein [Levilactobacillus tujiorum]NLR32618.1 AbrB/MazE/SpoVT family DNA-binding domain-containing protein [Levilactobacillus tujiorum]